MDTKTSTISEVLTDKEISKIIQAFLRNPKRAQKGAAEEEIIKVITWAHELKLVAEINSELLKEIVSGNIILDLVGDDVVMSRDKHNVQ